MARAQYPPLVKAALLATCFVGLWSTCLLLDKRELFRNVLQPLVFSFMVVGVLTPVVNASEYIIKLLFGFCLNFRSAMKFVTWGRYTWRNEAVTVPLNGPAAQHGRQISPQSPPASSKQIALEAIENNSLALEYAPTSLKNNADVVKEAVERNPQALWFASSRLKNDRDIVMAAVKQNGMMLSCASDRLRADPEVGQAAVLQNGMALQYVLKAPKHIESPASCWSCWSWFQESCVFDEKVVDQLEYYVLDGGQRGGLCPRVMAVLITLFVTFWLAVHILKEFWSRQLLTMNVEPYLKGLQELEVEFNVNQSQFIDRVREDVQDRQLAAGSAVASFAQMCVMSFIYIVILLINPMKEILPVFDVVRTYFARKTLSNTIYATIACIILRWLDCTIIPFIGVITFLLAFIPEIGAVISVALPVPLFLLDARLELDERYRRAISVLGLMVLNKFAIGNGVEAVLMGMGTSGSDEHRQAGRTHPVLVIFIVLVGAKIWGASGTLFAVPATWLLQAYWREQQRLWDMQVSRGAQIGESELAKFEFIQS